MRPGLAHLQIVINHMYKVQICKARLLSLASLDMLIALPNPDKGGCHA